MSSHLPKNERRRLLSYLKQSKPEDWRGLLAMLKEGPGFKGVGIYYECVRLGGIDDSVWRERWSVGGVMPPMPSAAIHSEKGLVEFFAGIKQRQRFGSTDSPTDPLPSATPAINASTGSSRHYEGVSPTEAAKAPRTPRKSASEKKRTISLMIEPSLYDRIKELADIQERSAGAQIRHALRLHLDENAHLLGDDVD